MTSFIETQFPIAQLSAECFKERKAGASQTLTGLGKWWGRKPLILVRATLLGLLMPASGDLSRDRRIFLKILTMDDDGVWQRCKGDIPVAEWKNAAPLDLREKYFGKKGFKSVLSKEEKNEALDEIWEALDAGEQQALDTKRSRDFSRTEFDRLPYSQRIRSCERPENIDGPSAAAWAEINAHLGTHASTLQELFAELSTKRFGERAKVGDCFCGGGSIPFEAARLGLDAYASDLNPIACLLTWGALNIVGGGFEKVAEVREEQERVYQAVADQIEQWGIERSEEGWRAEYYLHCVEVKMPDGWRVPLAPTWVIGKKTNTIAILVPDHKNKRFDFRIKMDATAEEMAQASKGTISDSLVTNPATGQSVKLSVIRGDRKEVIGHNAKGKPIKENRTNLRLWDATEWKPRPEDFYQERLYAIRWRNEAGKTVYREPTAFDLRSELKVEELLAERFTDWQRLGHIPSMKIEPGFNTAQPIRERGWAYWHQLFNPRQLLVNGLINFSKVPIFSLRFTENNSRLCRWGNGKEEDKNVFSDQSLATFFNYASTASYILPRTLVKNNFDIKVSKTIELNDARNIKNQCNFWITDPPYADAINYDELSEFFLSWIQTKLKRIFPNWYADSKRALAVRGKVGETFEDTLVEIYSNLRRHTLPSGMHVIMFTHSKGDVWLSLMRVIRRSGMQVLAVWAVRTETENASKGDGNYVKATYLVVLKPREARTPKPMAQIRGEITREVERLLGDMDSVNHGGELNFKYGDLLLAAPTAVLKVITSHEKILGLNELDREKFEKEMLEQAEELRDERLYPRGFEGKEWKNLSSGEHFYLMGLWQEFQGDQSQELYQISSKAYGVTDYGDLLASKKANDARLMTPLEIRGRAALLRVIGEKTPTAALLGAVAEAERKEDALMAHRYLRDELGTLTAESARALRTICRFLQMLKPLEHWQKSAHWLGEIEPGIGQL
jgi:putative DNA methylase